jgi:hypothetical protein
MTIDSSSRDTQPGILDDDAFVSGEPVSAAVLRAMARTGNYLRNAPSPMLSVVWPSQDETARSVFGAYECIAVWPAVPRRPNVTRAVARLRFAASLDGVFRILVRIDGVSRSREVTGLGLAATPNGSLEIVLPLPRDRTKLFHRVELWVRLVRPAANPANPVVVGTPITWTAPALDRGARDNGNQVILYDTTAAWNVPSNNTFETWVAIERDGIERSYPIAEWRSPTNFSFYLPEDMSGIAFVRDLYASTTAANVELRASSVLNPFAFTLWGIDL